MTQGRSNHFEKGEDLRVAGFGLEESTAAAVAERGSMTTLMAENSFQIVFEKLSEVRPEQWEPTQSESEVQALRKSSEEIAELMRELLEITEPPVSLFTRT